MTTSCARSVVVDVGTNTRLTTFSVGGTDKVMATLGEYARDVLPLVGVGVALGLLVCLALGSLWKH